MNKLETNKPLPLYLGIISFGVTFVRIILAFLCIPLLGTKSSEFLVTSLIIIIMVFDHYDGKLFKLSSLNEIPVWRRMRRVFDSCGDRICIQFVCIPLLFAHPGFFLSYLVICLKESLTSIICIKEFKQGQIIYPSKISKVSTVFIGLTAISGIFDNTFLIGIVTVILAFTGLLSCLSYRNLIKKMNAGELTEGIGFEFI